MSSESTNSFTSGNSKVCYVMTKATFKRFSSLIDKWKESREERLKKSIDRIAQKSTSTTNIPSPKDGQIRNGIMWNAFIYFEGDQ